MKITIETPKPGEEEIIIRCASLDDRLLNFISFLKAEQSGLTGYVEDKIVKLQPEDIFYFESVDNKVFAYTDKDVYEVRKKLYEISANTLWQILLSGFLTALVTDIMHVRECREKSLAILKCFIHYALLCVVMIICGSWFGWISPDPGGMAMMALYVAIVDLLTFAVYYLIDMRQARKINEKLKEKYHSFRS